MKRKQQKTGNGKSKGKKNQEKYKTEDKPENQKVTNQERREHTRTKEQAQQTQDENRRTNREWGNNTVLKYQTELTRGWGASGETRTRWCETGVAQKQTQGRNTGGKQNTGNTGEQEVETRHKK